MSDEKTITTAEDPKHPVEGKESAAEKATEATGKKPTHKKKASRNHPLPWLGISSLLLAMGAAVLAGYDFLLWQRLLPANDMLKSEVAGQGAKISTVQQTVDEVQRNLEDATRQFSDEQATINSAVQGINAKLGRTTVGWRLAEVEQLLVIANDRLSLDRDQHTALMALENADSKLQIIGDPAFLPVRKEISAEITALKAVNEPDIAGLALSLGSLMDNVAQLPLVDKVLAHEQTVNSRNQEGSRTWQQVLHGVWEDIKSLVRVRRHDQPVEPLLPPDEEWYLRQNLRLKLEEARLSLVRHDNEVFRQSLEESKRWVGAYFDSESAAVSNLIKTLNDLGKVTIAPALPDISASLRQLRDQMRRVDEQAAETNRKGGSS